MSEKSRHQKFTFSNDSLLKSFKLMMSYTDNIKFVNIGIDIQSTDTKVLRFCVSFVT